jgi:hypothetical protein
MPPEPLTLAAFGESVRRMAQLSLTNFAADCAMDG